jgi:hypothetical protein
VDGPGIVTTSILILGVFMHENDQTLNWGGMPTSSYLGHKNILELPFNSMLPAKKEMIETEYDWTKNICPWPKRHSRALWPKWRGYFDQAIFAKVFSSTLP